MSTKLFAFVWAPLSLTFSVWPNKYIFFMGFLNHEKQNTDNVAGSLVNGKVIV